MSLSGAVSIMGLEGLVGFLTTNELEGTLTVRSAESLARLHFLDGQLIASPLPGRRQSGRLGSGDLDSLLARGAEVRGTAAHVRQRRTPQDVIEKTLQEVQQEEPEAKRAAVTEALLDLFTWLSATFEFRPGPVPRKLAREHAAGESLVLDANGIVFEGLRRQDEAQRELSAHVADGALDPAPTAPLEIRGDLEGLGLAGLLQALRLRQRTGTLTVRCFGGAEELYFQDGEVYLPPEQSSSGAFAVDFLGADLLADVGDALGEGLGSLQERELRQLRERLEDRFLDVLFWKDATFVFEQGRLPVVNSDNYAAVPVDTEGFLLRATRQLIAWDPIRRALGSRDDALRFTTSDAKLEAINASSDTELRSTLTLIDGNLAFDELVQLSSLGYLEVGRAVGDLLESGALEHV